MYVIFLFLNTIVGIMMAHHHTFQLSLDYLLPFSSFVLLIVNLLAASVVQYCNYTVFYSIDIYCKPYSHVSHILVYISYIDIHLCDVGSIHLSSSLMLYQGIFATRIWDHASFPDSTG